MLWARRPEAADRMRHTHHNSKYRRDLLLLDSVQVTSDVETAAGAPDLWAVAVPALHLRSVAERIESHAREDVTVLSLTKGIEKDSLLTMTQMLDAVLTDVSGDRIGVLYGPSHSEEVGKGQPTTVVAAAPTPDVVHRIRSVFQTDSFCVYGSTDVMGVEIGGSAKNVLAIAAGMSDGVGYGDSEGDAYGTRPCRDTPPGNRPRGASRNVLGPHRDWRPHCNLHKPEQPQPLLWRAGRSGQDIRRGAQRNGHGG